MDIYAIIGAGGFGREVLPLVKERVGMFSESPYRIIFVDDGINAKEINGTEVITSSEFKTITGTNKFFNIAIGNSKVRETIAQDMIDRKSVV